MDDLEEKLSAILGNPEMMSRLMSMAQSLGQSAAPAQPQNPEPPPPSPPQESSMDFSMLRRMAAIARQSGVDPNQQALLKALAPYLSRGRIEKLEKAMRAAKLASMASLALNGSGAPNHSGR